MEGDIKRQTQTMKEAFSESRTGEIGGDGGRYKETDTDKERDIQ